MKENSYGLSIDGSSDNQREKMYPLTVRVFDESGLSMELLQMCVSDSSTAEGIFSVMHNELSVHEISWNNCSGIGLDNTNTNVGKRNSVITRIHSKNESVYLSGCPAHMLHNAALKASKAFSKITSFEVEDFMIDIFYHFDKSSKRKNVLSEFCLLYDAEFYEILRYCSTRWLSLETSVSRILKLFHPLKSYFISENENNDRFKRLQKHFQNPMLEVYLLFYHSALQNFIHFNKWLQSDSPLIPLLDSAIQDFITKLCCRFLKVEKVSTVGVYEIDLEDDSNKRSLDELDIGFGTRQEVHKLREDGHDRKIILFLKGVLAFFVKAVSYAKENLPIDDKLLKNSSFLNFSLRRKSDFTQIEYFINRFPILAQFKDEEQNRRLKDEFYSYVMLNDNDLEAMGINVDKNELDKLWIQLSKVKNPIDDSYRFQNLFKVAKSILVIPHSNAAEERVFSLVRRNKTSFRPNLNTKESLGSILITKLALKRKATFEPDTKLLQKAKKACTSYNASKSSK